MNGSDQISSAPPPELPPPPSESATLLAPGFRFHPTDDELVTYYLKRKIQNKPLRVDAITEIDLYKCEPWDLPSKSRIRSRDLEWYFFSPLDRKHSNNRLRTNRGTEHGYWKTTGKDREVRHGGKVAGMKKTLVYHDGRAPRGKRTNWVMHEYRLESDGISEESYVVCRIFQKNGPGPQNGAQYGAPFVEDEWDELTSDTKINNNNNGLLIMETSNLSHNDNDNDDDSNDLIEREFLQIDDLLQNQAPPPAPLPDMSELEMIFQEPMFTGEENSSTVLDNSSPSKTEEYLELNDLASELLVFPNNNEQEEETLNFDEFFDPKDSFMQMSEIIYSPVTSQNSGLDFIDDFLTYYDAPDDNLFYNDFDYNKVMDENSIVASNLIHGASSSTMLQEANNDMFINHENEDVDILSDKKPLGKFASFLDSFSAPPAFAEEFPATSSKSTNLLSSYVDPVHVMTNMIQIGNADMELLLSYKSVEYDTNPKYCGVSSVLRGGFCLFFLSAVMLGISYKIGLCVCDR